MRKNRLAFAAWGFTVPAVLILIAALAYPIFYTFQMSFSTLDISTFTPASNVGFDNYARALGDDAFRNSMWVTALYLIMALPLQMVLGFGIAYLLNVEWRGRGLLRALFIVPMVVAPVVAGGIWKMLLDPLWGLVNYVFGFIGLGDVRWLSDPGLALISVTLIDTWRWTPFVVLIASAGILALPKDVFEAARIDGANAIQTLFRVALPLLVPVIAATFIVRWLGAVKMFDIVLAATRGGPGRSTDVVNHHVYETAFRALQFDLASAQSVIVLVITMALTYVFVKISRHLENRW